MTTNCIRTSSCGAHFRFQMIVPYGCNFAKCYDINTLRLSFVIFRGQTKHMVRVRLCPSLGMLSVNMDVSVAGRIVGDIVLGPYLLPDRLTAQ
jgi:hypothetical protein